MALLLAAQSPAASEPSRIRPNVETGSGLISGQWVRAGKFPAARVLGRGYRKKAVDRFLIECANGVDWLRGLLVGAENEIDRLNGLLAVANDEIDRLTAGSPVVRKITGSKAAAQTGTRPLGRAALKRRKRPERRSKRPRIRIGSHYRSGSHRTGSSA